MIEVTRRQTLIGGMSVLAVSYLGVLPALSKSNGYEEAVAKFTGGKDAKEGRIKIDVPEIAENGNTVPLSVSVESPMSKDDYVKRVMILADGNPRPGVATFNYTPDSGVAEASTRIRLAGTQNLVVLAEMSDGSYYKAIRQVKVTIGGCGG
ncbi:MAG: thiosulfate oxidation carrier protein SoxY [Hyphomicrobiales bacterium]